MPIFGTLFVPFGNLLSYSRSAAVSAEADGSAEILDLDFDFRIVRVDNVLVIS